MAIPEILTAYLTGLVGGRIYPSRFPQPQDNQAPIWPAIRYTMISDIPGSSLCGNDYGIDDVRVRLDLVAQTYLDMRQLKVDVTNALDVTDPPSLRQAGGFEVFDADTKTHRASLEYVFYPSSEPS